MMMAKLMIVMGNIAVFFQKKNNFKKNRNISEVLYIITLLVINAIHYLGTLAHCAYYEIII